MADVGTSMTLMKRVYYFTPPDYALENLQKKHLKVSRFSRCNDRFELASLSLKNRELRGLFRKWLSQMDEQHGLLCFCRSWRNPVMWGHYAKHLTGMCYGFDVDPTTVADVRYVSERLHPNLSPENFFDHIRKDQMADLFATKFINWSYEEEVRLLVTFSTNVAKNKPVFHVFSQSMLLKEVIVGPESKIRVSDVESVVSDKNVNVFRSRLAFQRFEIVRQQNKNIGR